MESEILIVKNLNVYCPTENRKNIKILDNISFDLEENDILGLVGETGSGKTVLINSLGKNLSNPLWMDSKNLMFNFVNQKIDLTVKSLEEMKKIWGKGIAFIPPNAKERFNPILKIGQQFINIIQAHTKLSKIDARKEGINCFKKVNMPAPERVMDDYPHNLSGGMAQRVLISIALFLSPKLLLADEPTMGLDVTIQKQVLDILYNLISEMNSSVILATRDLGIVANYCNKVGVLCNGQLVEFSDKTNFFNNAKHPYSKYLLEAAFSSQGKMLKEDFQLLKSRNEIETRTERGCRFSSRCKLVDKVCFKKDPPDFFIEKGHLIKCHFCERL